MTKFIAGYILGLFLGVMTAVTIQEVAWGNGTGATPSPNLLIGTASSSLAADTTLKFTPQTSFIFWGGKGGKELLRISMDGTVTYQGRMLGTDKEIWVALRATFEPGRVCQEWEEDMRWVKP